MSYHISTLTIPQRSHFLYISSRPGFGAMGLEGEIEQFISRIRRMEIQAVMVLMPEEELLETYGHDVAEDYRSAGLTTFHCPIDDFSVPQQLEGEGGFSSCVEELWNQLEKSHVLVHCAAGLGRSGLTAACLLVRAGMKADEAVTRVRRTRPGTLQTLEQERFVHRYGRSL